MSDVLTNYINALQRKLTEGTLQLIPDKHGKLPVVDIHAWFANIELYDDCPDDVRKIHDGITALCSAIIAYDDALVRSMEEYPEDTALHEILETMQQTFEEEVIG